MFYVEVVTILLGGQVIGVWQWWHGAIHAARGTTKSKTDSCGELGLVARRLGMPKMSHSCVTRSVHGLRGPCVCHGYKARF
jgi:hypothetical protein